MTDGRLWTSSDLFPVHSQKTISRRMLFCDERHATWEESERHSNDVDKEKKLQGRFYFFIILNIIKGNAWIV